MNKAPCYGCTDRSPVCHAQCAAYREWLKEYREIKARTRRTDGEQAAEEFLFDQGKRAKLAKARERTRARELGAEGRMLHK